MRKLDQDIEFCQQQSFSKFQGTDIFYGIGGTLVGLSILMWLPFLWWAVPIWLVISPFLGTYWRQEYYQKKLIKLNQMKK